MLHQNRNYSIFFTALIYFVNKITEGKNKLESLKNSYLSLSEVVEKEGIVTLVLEGAVFVQFGEEQPVQVPPKAYKKISDYKTGIHVIAKYEGKIIAQIRPLQ